jgi:hypothetical protein
MKNVLVFPCGSEIGLEINRSLARSKHFSLFGASSVDDHGKFVYERYIDGLPFIDNPHFLRDFNRVIEKNRIDFVFPAHDSAVLTLAENQDAISATVVTSCAETCRVCRSKEKTYERFAGLLPTPRVYSPSDAIPLPAFLKPNVGEGTKGTHKAASNDDVAFHLRKDPTLLVLEYLPGKEFTVDCFTDRKGALRFAAGRERKRIYNGISVNSSERADSRFAEMAKIINETLRFQGVWFFQVKERSNGELVLMEIAPRIAGAMALFRVTGINFAELSLFDRMGVDVSLIRNDVETEIDRALFSRFKINYEYERVYIDFDDTLVVGGSVNTEAIRFLYQARNQGKRISLLSRHRENITDTLRKFAICESLFDEINVLRDRQRKSDLIAPGLAIFIDDSFAERKEVFDARHIPVFGLDAIESLLEWRA